MMKMNPPLESLFEKARAHEPHGEVTTFGFETRLRAALSDQIPGSLELFGNLSWRFTMACLPLLLLSAYLMGVHESGFLPEGLGGVVGQWSALIPGGLL